MRLLLLIPFILLLSSCAARIPHYFPDSYFQEDRIYHNKPLGFSLNFTGVWEIITDGNNMDGSTRELAQTLHASGAELLFVGSTVEGTQGCRAIAANMNFSPQSYADTIRAINRDDLSTDSGFTPFIAGSRAMIKWRYRIDRFEFVEFFFKISTYNIRMAFWARPDIFTRFEPVFEDIMRTVILDNR